jgi:transketolase
VADTLKGKGVKFMEEGKNAWHGAAPSSEQARKGPRRNPESHFLRSRAMIDQSVKPVATRQAFGEALAKLGEKYP